MNQIRVGGLTPLTTIDYPGELSAVIFCQGCPWRCGYCQNSQLLSSKATGLIEWSSVMAFLNKRVGLLDAVVFSGGEPTLQRGIADAIRQVKSLGFKVGLHTAGCYPDRLKKILPLVDWVGLDIKELAENYSAITQVKTSGEQAWQSLDILQSAGVDYEVRTTRMPGTADDSILAMASQLADRGVRRYALQQCQTGRCLDPDLRDLQPDLPGTQLTHQLQQVFPVFSYRQAV